MLYSPATRVHTVSVPSSVPPTWPDPPVTRTPPTTTQAMASSSSPGWASALALPYFMTSAAPHIPATSPEQTYSPSFTRRTGSPANTAARSLSPTAYTTRPTQVWWTTTQPAAASTARPRSGTGTPSGVASQNSPSAGGKLRTGWSPLMVLARPRNSSRVASVATSGSTPPPASEPLSS